MYLGEGGRGRKGGSEGKERRRADASYSTVTSFVKDWSYMGGGKNWGGGEKNTKIKTKKAFLKNQLLCGLESMELAVVVMGIVLKI